MIATPQALDPVNSLGPAGVAAFGAHVPLGRSGVPEDIAAAYLYLASAEAGYVTGAVIPVDRTDVAFEAVGVFARPSGASGDGAGRGVARVGEKP